MSYSIIRSIKVKNDKVFFRYRSNNIWPARYHEEESLSLSKILKEEGKMALDIEILREYENGNFQKGSNRYTRALEILRHLPEYSKFDWRGNWEESKKNREKEKEFDKLLKIALTSKQPKKGFVIFKLVNDRKAYFSQRANAGFCRWYYDKDKAKGFRWKEDAEFAKKCFTGSENWKIENF